MDTTRKKHTVHKKTEHAAIEKGPQLDKDTKEAPVESAKATAQATKAATSSDPLAGFKEKMNEEEHPASDIPQKKNFMWPILFVVFLALALLAGIFIYKQGMSRSSSEKVNVVTLSPTPTLSPEPTKAKIDLSKYEIKILNGSSISGEAGRQKDSLEGLGFTVSGVANADNSDYTDTIIRAKEEVDKDFLDKLKSVLESTFTLGDFENLSDDASTPIVIIIGTKK